MKTGHEMMRNSMRMAKGMDPERLRGVSTPSAVGPVEETACLPDGSGFHSPAVRSMAKRLRAAKNFGEVVRKSTNEELDIIAGELQELSDHKFLAGSVKGLKKILENEKSKRNN